MKLFVILIATAFLSACQSSEDSDLDDDPVDIIEPRSKPIRAQKDDSDFGMVSKRKSVPRGDGAASQVSEPDDDADDAPEIPKVKLYVIAEFLHVRKKPDRFSASVGYKHGGDVVYVTIKGDWSKLDKGHWIRTRWLSSELPERFVHAK